MHTRVFYNEMITISSSVYSIRLLDIAYSKVNSILALAYGISTGAFRLEHFNYRSDALANITFGHLTNTSLNGITVNSTIM